jgi:hypothetical protein
MATPQLSPGVLTREVDLTVGRADNVLDNVGGIAGPFEIGPVDVPITVTTEQELINAFGKPKTEYKHYEYWMSAASYLSYGGIVNVVRTDGANLKNSNVGLGTESSDLKIKNFDDYNANISESASDFLYSAKNPGSWANDIKICVIDDFADQIVGFATTSISVGSGINAQVGYGITVDITGKVIPGAGTTQAFEGYLKGIITQVVDGPELSKSFLSVKIHSLVSTGGTEPGKHQRVDYSLGSDIYSFLAEQRVNIIDNNDRIVSFVDAVGDLNSTFVDTAIASEKGNTYSGVAGVAANNGQDATFNVTRNTTDGSVESITVANPGIGFTTSETVTIAGSLVGGYDLSFGAVASTGISSAPTVGTSVNTAFFNISGVGTDGGTGVTFNIYRNNVGGISTVTLVDPGQNFGVGEEITILGSAIGGIAPNDNLVLTADTLRDDEITLQVDSLISRAQIERVDDWYNSQTLGLDNSNILWSSIAPKPGTSNYADQRNGESDEMHIVVVDDSGALTGIRGNILEKHLFLSKATDAISQVNSPEKIWYKNYLANFSDYIYAGANQSGGFDNYHNTQPTSTVFVRNFNVSYPFSIIPGVSDYPTTFSTPPLEDLAWDREAKDNAFSVIGAVTYTLAGGNDYTIDNGLRSTLGDLIAAYERFSNKEDTVVDFLLMGPGLDSIGESQAKANKIIAIAESRKDCMALISPHRSSVVDITNTTTQMNNIIEFFGPLQSSSYAVFDSGYKYTYDRFNNVFRYIPCNPDVAGLMARTNLVAYPWFSPAGQQRGIIKNAIKLAFNPGKNQRDRLYSARINPIVSQPGLGVLLFGDKTALGYASAFDRINVRRLFLTVEQSLERAAEAQLFEFNDQITRSNFVNIVEPYLRDVRAKRGIYDFLIICDETNNTPDVIDNNEFRADIFLKPAKSINYVTLTFVATRTGISFEEVAGRV